MRSEPLGICIKPVNGWLISRIRKRRGCRQRKDDQRRDERGVEGSEQAEVRGNDREPEHQHREERMGIELPAWTNNAKRGRAKSVVRLDALGGQFHGGRQVIDAPIRDGGRAAR